MKARIAVFSFFLVSQSALAGDEHYGCVGRLRTGDQITFNRENLVIMSRALADGKLPEEGDDQLSTFQSVGSDGFDTTMTFQHVWSGSVSRVVLTEKASKTVSSQTKDFACTGGRHRELNRTIYLKTYEYKSDDDASPHPETVKMHCYEFTISACG